MQKAFIINLLVFLVSFCAVSQNETANWYFGNEAGLSFNNGVRTILYDGAMTAPSGCSSISDRDGNLRFYSNGETIWNSNHQVMANGSGLAGDVEHTQTSIIVPNPENEDVYYIFTLRKENGNSFGKGIYYSIVEFSSANPLGEVTEKNVKLNNASGERITATYLPEANYYKIITFSKAPYTLVFPEFPPVDQEIDTFCFFNVTASGVSFSSMASVENATISTAGTMKISPNGEHLAIADYGQSRVFIYDIDSSSDALEYRFSIFTGLFGAPDIAPYGLEFSPDSQIVYFSNSVGAIYKFNINSEAYTIDKIYVGGGNGALQLASDGKIYIANFSTDGNQSNYISVINDPNSPDAECGFENFSINLSPNGSFKGLPNFIQSYFENRILTENRCVFDAFDFEINAYGPVVAAQWEFGDGNTSDSLTPNHQYDNPGTYIVMATIQVYGHSIDLYKQIKVFPLPNADEGVVITQCDMDADGISFFNLNTFADYVENSDSIDFELSFFNTLENALNDSNPIANPEAYENSINPEQVFVRIKSPEGCMTVSNFYIQSTFAPLNNIRSMYVCEDSDSVFGNSIGKFDLRPIPNEIRLQFGIPESATITFYATLQDAQTMTNPLTLPHFTTTTTIWVRVEESNGECSGVGSIDLYVNSNLNINLENQYKICHPSLQPPLMLDGGVSNDGWEWKDSSGNIISIQRFFNVTDPGDYSLTVYKTENDLECSISKNFTVDIFETPSFEYLIGDDYQIQIGMNGSSSYEYSLNGTQYYGEGTTYIFSGISAGVYTVYVRDLANCEPPISQDVSFVGFPKFFTPNNDSYHDTWKIEGLSDDLYASAEVNIYDRYGKFLFSMNLETNNYGWDGLWEEKILTPTDYWFVAKLIDLQNNVINKTGHFSLRL